MSIQDLSAKLVTAGVQHVVVIASALPKSITQKQLNGFKLAMMNGWSANEEYNEAKFGIDAATYHLLKDIASQLYGYELSGWRVLKLSEVIKALGGSKVQSTYYIPSDYVKKLYSATASSATASNEKFKVPAFTNWKYDDGLVSEMRMHIWEWKPVRNHRVTISMQTTGTGMLPTGVAKVSAFNIPDKGSWYLVAQDGGHYKFSRSGEEATFNNAKEAYSAFKRTYEKYAPDEATAAFPKKASAQTPDGWDAALETFKQGVQDIIEKYNKDNDFKQSQGSKITSEDAQKYTKVFVIEPHGNKRIYCFIDRSNGDILKPATFSSPAKGARGSIFDDNHGLKRMGPYGPAYNK